MHLSTSIFCRPKYIICAPDCLFACVQILQVQPSVPSLKIWPHFQWDTDLVGDFNEETHFKPYPSFWFPFQARIRKFGPKILQLLTEWTETFPYDFQEERMIGHLKDMIHRIAPCDEVSRFDPGHCVEMLCSFSHLVPPFPPFATLCSVPLPGNSYSFVLL